MSEELCRVGARLENVRDINAENVLQGAPSFTTEEAEALYLYNVARNMSRAKLHRCNATIKTLEFYSTFDTFKHLMALRENVFQFVIKRIKPLTVNRVEILGHIRKANWLLKSLPASQNFIIISVLSLNAVTVVHLATSASPVESPKTFFVM